MHSTAEKEWWIQWMLLVQTKTLPPWKLTWQWKLHHLSQCNFLLKLWIFQCQVSFPGCTLSVPFAHTSGSRNKPKESPAFVVNRGDWLGTAWFVPDSSSSSWWWHLDLTNPTGILFLCEDFKWTYKIRSHLWLLRHATKQQNLCGDAPSKSSNTDINGESGPYPCVIVTNLACKQITRLLHSQRRNTSPNKKKHEHPNLSKTLFGY